MSQYPTNTIRVASFLLAALAWLLPVVARAEVDSAFLEALRERRLFELAEKHCRDELAGQELSPAEQAELTVELIRTCALHAVYAPGDERPELWGQARATARDFFARQPQHPRRVLIEVQDALTLLAQGEIARQEFEVGVLSAEASESARQTLREATSLLEAIDKRLEREIPLRNRGVVKAGELSGDELFSLRQQVRQQLARSLQNRALLYEAGSDDRLSLLLSVRQTLQSLLTEVAEDDPLRGQVRLDLAVCLRRLGEREAAGPLLAELVQDESPAIRERARAEQLRIALDEKDISAANRIVEERGAGRRSAEFDLAVLEFYVARWRTAAETRQADQSTKWQQQAAQQAAYLSQTHGAYWGRRADQLIARSLPESGDGASAAILGRTADNLYRKGEFAQAVAAYEKGSEQALASGDPRAGFELAYKAALVQQQRKEHADAAARLRELAQRLRTHERAAEAHQLAAWNAAQQARTDPQALDAYADILREHAEIWPQAATLGQMQLWLGRLCESQGKWAEAFAAYQAVPPESPQFPVSVENAANSAKKWLGRLQAENKPTDKALEQAAGFFEAVTAGAATKETAWSDAERLAALTLAELWLDFGQQQAAEAQRVLERALEASPEAPADWRAAATVRLVVALASQNEKQAEAAELLRQAAAVSPAQLLEVIVGLASIVEQATGRQRVAVAKLTLDAIAQLDPSRGQLDKNAQLLVDRLQAEALAAADQRSQAVELYGRLAAQQPDSAVVQEGYAQLLLDGSDPPSLHKALDQWRRIAARSRPRTERWYRAKYSIALAQFRSGDKQAAASLLRYMLETPPGLAGSGFESQYTDLLRKCEK